MIAMHQADRINLTGYILRRKRSGGFQGTLYYGSGSTGCCWAVYLLLLLLLFLAVPVSGVA
jgi:hypothetical protein